MALTTLNLTGGIAYWYNKDFDDVCQLIQDKLSDWHDQYDERYCNEPEYPSQQDRWQDALDSFEERIDALEDIERHYQDWLDKFKKQYKVGTPRDMVHRSYDIDMEGLEKVLNEILELNSYRQKGLTDIVKRLRGITKQLRWDIHINEIEQH